MTNYLTESFTGSDGSAWSSSRWTVANQTTGASAQIQTNRGRMNAGTLTGYSGKMSMRYNLTTYAAMEQKGTFQYLDSSIDHRIEIWSRTDSGISGGNGYFARLNRGGTVYIYKAVGYSYTNLGSASFTINATTDYKFRFYTVGTALKLRVWAAADSEPGTWNISTTDSSITAAGYAGAHLQGGSSASGRVDLDDWTVTDGTDNAYTYTGSTSPTGAFRKGLARTFTGAVTPAGAYSYLKVALRTFTASASSSGAMAVGALKRFAGSTSPTGQNFKEIRRTFVGAAASAGAFRKSFVRILSGAVTPVGTLAETFLGRIFGRAGYAAMEVTRNAIVRLRIRKG